MPVPWRILALLVAEQVEHFNIKPVIALVSFSNFGAIKVASPDRAREAVEILHKEHPESDCGWRNANELCLEYRIENAEVSF